MIADPTCEPMPLACINSRHVLSRYKLEIKAACWRHRSMQPLYLLLRQLVRHRRNQGSAPSPALDGEDDIALHVPRAHPGKKREDSDLSEADYRHGSPKLQAALESRNRELQERSTGSIECTS